MEKLEKTKITKILSTILIIILLFNVFSPCLSFAAYKQDGQDKYNVLRVSNITKSSSGNYVFYVEYAAIADTYIGSFDISLSYDTSKFATARKDTGAANTSAAKVTDANSDCFIFQTKTVSNGTIRMTGTTTDWWCATDDGDESASFGSELSIFKVYFYLLNPSQWKLDGSKEITSDMISLKPSASLQTGYKQRIAQDVDGTSPTYITDTKYLATEGFAEKEKTVSSISVKTNPSKTTYEHNDAINLAGGVLKVTYDDNTTEDISMTDTNVKITKPTTGKADVNNQTITISYKGQTTTLKLNVTDPVTSLAVATPMNKVEYNHGETFDFTGLALKATKKSGATINLNASSSGVTKSETTANVNSANFTKTSAEGTVPVSGIQKITFTYEGKTATQSVAVNDTISSIALTKQPTKTVYKQGENLDLTGAVVQVTLGSGGKANINLPDGSVTVSTYNPSTTGSKQHLTVKLGTLTASNTIDVEAYNYISSSTLVKPSKTSYKYGEALDLKGGKLDFTWKSGNMTNVSLSTDIVSGYNATKLGTQTITVKYNAKYTLSDGNTVTDTITKTFTVNVDNEAKSIEITPPSKTQYNYGSKLDLAGGKIAVKYADGTTEYVTMATDMIIETDGSNVNMSPDVTNFTDNKLSKTLKISYTEDEATKTVDYPVTIINDIKSITMHTTPTKTKYNVNDALDVTNGEIKITRAIGEPEIKSITSSMVTGFNSSKENTALPLTVSYTENGITKTTTYNVSVEDQVTAIKISQTPKTSYKYNEELDVSTGKLEITKGSGTTTIPMTTSMVTGYDKTKLGNQELTVTYGGKTEKYTVNVKDYVTGISVKPASITGKYNTELGTLIKNNDITYTVTYAKEGAKSPKALTESMVTGYNKTSLTAQNLTVTYTDEDLESYTNGQVFKTNLSIKLENEAAKVTITPPTKTKYNHGDQIDLTGGKITVTYLDGTTGTKEIELATITEEDGTTLNMSPEASKYGENNTYSKTLKISYVTDNNVTGTVNYPVTIINDIKSITMHTTPTKTKYNVNDALDVTNGEIKITRATGEPEIKAIKSSMVTGFDSSKENTALPLTVSYTENGITKTTTYNVSVEDQVTAIKISQTPKTSYKYNEELDVSIGKLEITKGSGTTTIPMTISMVTGYDKTKLGNQELTVTYGGKTEKYTVNVKDYVTGISVKPASITGKYNTELGTLIEDNDITYTVTYAKEGTKSPKALTESMVTGYDKTSLTAQNLTVTYTDEDLESYTNGQIFKTNLSVKLENEVAKVTITPPTKTEYNHGDQIDLTGGKITLTYTDGTTKEEPITSATVTEKDGGAPNMSPTTAEYGDSNTISKTLTLKYTSGNGVTGTVDYPITIKDYVKSITMHTTPTKTKYNVNDALDVANGEIKIIRASGKAEIKEITKEMVSGFDSSKENTALPLTVSYTENEITKTTTYNVSVEDQITSMKILQTPKTNYKYNEELDVSIGKLEITKGSGTTTIPMTTSMVTGYDKTRLGDQELTVTYGGKTEKYTVNVKDYVTGISINPTSITGRYNTEVETLIEDNDITYTVTYAKEGAKTPKALTESMVTGYDKTSLTAQNLTVTYTDEDLESYTNGQVFKTNLSVKLENEVAKVTITPPTKTEYNHGDQIDLTGGKITLTYTDGTTKEEPITSATVTEKDGGAPNMSPTTAEYGDSNTISKTLTLKYTSGNGVTGTVDYTITINDQIKTITIKTTPTKTKYNVNEELDVTDGKINITRLSGRTEIKEITKEMVSGFDSSKENRELPLTVSYTENGITKTTTYNVSVEDQITSMKILQTPKTNYKYNEELDVSTGKLEITRGSGTTTIPMTTSMVTGYNKTKLGEQELTVTYGGKTEKYTVNVKDYITGVILTPPTKVKYEYGESLDLTGGNIQKVMASGATTSPVELTDSIVTVSGYNPKQEGAQTIDVIYEGQKEQFGVIVENNIQSIIIKNTPKTEYKYGEALDITGGTIETIRSNGAKETVNITTSMVTGYNPNKIGKQKITVTYKDKTTTYEVDVKDYIEDINIVKPDKLVYTIGEKIDLAGGKVNVIMASGTATTPVAMTNDEVQIDGFDTSTEGAKTIKVTYKGHTKTFGITVIDQTSSMTIKTLPNKLEYKYGESLDLTGGTIEFKQGSETKIINITKDMVTGYNPKKIGNQTLTVTYEGLTQEFIVNVKDYITKLELKKPDKIDYEYGENLDLTGGTISIITASGKIDEKVDITASMISGYDKTKEGTQTITVEYKGLQGKFQVNVKDKIKAISLNNEPNKINYKYNEALDITGATIDIIKSSGIYTIPVTDEMISGYNPQNSGLQVVTITYKGFKTKFLVLVAEKEEVKEPEQEEIKEEPKKEEKQEEAKTEIIKTVTKNKTIIINNNTKDETKEEKQPAEEKVETPINEENNKEPNTEPTEEKETATLGVKDEKINDSKKLAEFMCILGTLMLLLLLIFKRNVKIYVEEDGEFVLGGIDKITKKNPELNIDEYLDGETYPNKVKVHLSDSISEKLDGKEIEIKHRGKIIKIKIVYEDKPYEIILK